VSGYRAAERRRSAASGAGLRKSAKKTNVFSREYFV